jgi:hypothetical protein
VALDCGFGTTPRDCQVNQAHRLGLIRRRPHNAGHRHRHVRLNAGARLPPSRHMHADRAMMRDERGGTPTNPVLASLE